jgi:hypothetical protein
MEEGNSIKPLPRDPGWSHPSVVNNILIKVICSLNPCLSEAVNHFHEACRLNPGSLVIAIRIIHTSCVEAATRIIPTDYSLGVKNNQIIRGSPIIVSGEYHPKQSLKLAAVHTYMDLAVCTLF